MYNTHDARRRGVAFAKTKDAAPSTTAARDGFADGVFCWESVGGLVTGEALDFGILFTP